VEVEFNHEEKESYTALDNAARHFYTNFKEENGDELSKHYLLLSQKLMPLRIAASGGRIPLDDEEGEKPDEEGEKPEEEEKAEESADDIEGETPAPRKKKAKKEKRFSEFAYKSKLKVLLDELKRARDEDPRCKCARCVARRPSIAFHRRHPFVVSLVSLCAAKSLVFSQFTSTLDYLQQELPNHGFQFRTLSGDMSMRKRAKALHDFQHDPPTTVFLLSMRRELSLSYLKLLSMFPFFMLTILVPSLSR
jgi:SNF2 family DNA or RNA helicase